MGVGMGSVAAFNRIDKLRVQPYLLDNALNNSEGMGVHHHSARVFDYFILFLHRVGLYLGVVYKPLFIDTVNEKFGGLKVGLQSEKNRKAYLVAFLLGRAVSGAVSSYPLLPGKALIDAVVASPEVVCDHYSGIASGLICPHHFGAGINGAGTGFVCMTMGFIKIHYFPSKDVFHQKKLLKNIHIKHTYNKTF